MLHISNTSLYLYFSISPKRGFLFNLFCFVCSAFLTILYCWFGDTQHFQAPVDSPICGVRSRDSQWLGVYARVAGSFVSMHWPVSPITTIQLGNFFLDQRWLSWWTSEVHVVYSCKGQGQMDLSFWKRNLPGDHADLLTFMLFEPKKYAAQVFLFYSGFIGCMLDPSQGLRKHIF